MTDKDRLLTDDTVKPRTVVEFASLVGSEDSAHDFIVKFSPSVCVAVVTSLIREVAVRSFAYRAHGTNPAVIHGHDKTLNQQCMLAQARPSMIIILLVGYVTGIGNIQVYAAIPYIMSCGHSVHA